MQPSSYVNLMVAFVGCNRDLTQNRIATFEIRQTDVAVFKQLDLFTGTITQQDCQDASAEVLSLQNGSAKLCVISGEFPRIGCRWRMYPGLDETG